MKSDLVKLTDAGLYCEAGDFYIDPWRPVQRAVITHAHSDHARAGNGSYLTAAAGERLLKARLDTDSTVATVETVEYGETITMGSVRVSLHPAGHILGSAQVRIESNGEVWVVSGDYKVQPDSTCLPLEPIKCDTYITESTFGLPIFRWHDSQIVFESINDWWRNNKENGKTSLLFGYALGKAQRILSGIDPSIGPIYTHGSVERLTMVYRGCGVNLPETKHVGSMPKGTKFGGSLILAPPSAQATPWTRVFGSVSTAFASGWMRIRGTRRRKSVDRGFVLSDHADWPGLLSVIEETGASRVIVTHGYTAELVRWLNEKSKEASALVTQFEGEMEELQPKEADDGESGDENEQAIEGDHAGESDHASEVER